MHKIKGQALDLRELQEVATVEIDPRSELRVSIGRRRNRFYVDLRTFKDNRSGDRVRSHVGLVLPTERAGELADAISLAGRATQTSHEIAQGQN